MEERVLLHRDVFKIDSLISAHENFASNVNSAFHLIKEEYPMLTFGFDIDFLMEMLRGKVQISINAFGVSRYKKMLEETELKKRFGNDGLVLDLSKALDLFSLPDFSRELEIMLHECQHAVTASVKINNLEISEGKVVLSEESRELIIKKFSHEITGVEAIQYRKLESLLNEFNGILNEMHGETQYLGIESIFNNGSNDKGNPEIQLRPSVVPSQRAMLLAARIAVDGGSARLAQDYMNDPHVASRHILGKPGGIDG